jgi:oligoendopeptidase F
MTHKVGDWDLASLGVTSLAPIMQVIKQNVAILEESKQQLTNKISSKKFLEIFEKIEKLRVLMSKLGVYAHLKFAENSGNQGSVAQMSAVENFLTKIGNRLLFFPLWFKGLPDRKAKELIKASKKYHYYFESLRKMGKYTLAENEEKLINLKDTTGVSALTNIYNITTAGFEYKFRGRKRQQEEMVPFVRSTSARVRQEAYQALLRPYKANKNVLGEIYKNIVNDWREENIGLRGYKNPIHVRNVYNDIPDEAVDVLLKVCLKNQHIFHKFFEIKREKLKLQKLRRFAGDVQ